MPDLLVHCPFCGETKQAVVPSVDEAEEFAADGFNVKCDNCGASILGFTREDAIQSWNRRTPGPATKALLEQAKMIVSGNVGSKWMELLQDVIDELS
jgi:Lar family restriction alleviation protein